ncbi:hypothetical protein HK096_004474, partial [Nowakowskiella sp. JEL0078]
LLSLDELLEMKCLPLRGNRIYKDIVNNISDMSIVVLRSFCKEGDLAGAWCWYFQWRKIFQPTKENEGYNSNSRRRIRHLVFSPFLIEVVRQKNKSLLLALLRDMENFGIKPDLKILSLLVTFFGNLGKIKEAEKHFKQIKKPDKIAYTALINAYVKEGDLKSVNHIIEAMEKSGIHFDNWMLSILVNAHSRKNNLLEAKKIFLKSNKSEIDAPILTSAVNMQESIIEAESLVRSMETAVQNPMSLQWAFSTVANRMIVNKDWRNFYDFSKWFEESGGSITKSVKSTLCSTLLSERNWNGAWNIILDLHSRSELDTIIVNIVIKGVFKGLSKGEYDVRAFFEEIVPKYPILNESRRFSELFKLLPYPVSAILTIFLYKFGIKFSCELQPTIILGLGSLRMFDQLENYMKILSKLSVTATQKSPAAIPLIDLKTNTAFISTLSRSHDTHFQRAMYYFESIPPESKSDRTLLTSVMHAHSNRILNLKQMIPLIYRVNISNNDTHKFFEIPSQEARNRKNLQIVELMFKKICEISIPDTVVFNILISAYRRAGDVDSAFRCFAMMIERKISPSLETYTSLMASQTWSSKNLSLEIWSDMMKSGIKPDAIAVSALLLALCVKKDLGSARKLIQSLNSVLGPNDGTERTSIMTALVRGIWEDALKESDSTKSEIKMQKAKKEIMEIVSEVRMRGELDRYFIETVQMTGVDVNFVEEIDTSWLFPKESIEKS